MIRQYTQPTRQDYLREIMKTLNEARKLIDAASPYRLHENFDVVYKCKAASDSIAGAVQSLSQQLVALDMPHSIEGQPEE